MGKDKHVIWTNDSSTRESEEKYIKGDWIDEICDAKSAEAEFEQEDCEEISGEQDRG